MTTLEKPKLIDQLNAKIVQLGYSHKTAKVYVHWTRQFLKFHRHLDSSGKWQWRNPRDMSEVDVESYLTWLANVRHVSPSTQSQAFNALIFLYRHIIGRTLVGIDAIRPKKAIHVPEILSVEEVRALLDNVRGVPLLVVSLLYGAGLRIGECCSLRIKDVDFDRRQIAIRGGKGRKDRPTQLPESLIPDLQQQITTAESWCTFDRRKGNFGVSMPFALARKYPRAPLDPRWYFIFSSGNLSRDPLRPELPLARHHIHEDTISKAVRRAADAAGITKHVSPHLLRHAYCSHMLDSGKNIVDVSELMGHNSILTTHGYSHTSTRGPTSIQSPLDRLHEQLANPTLANRKHNGLRIA